MAPTSTVAQARVQVVRWGNSQAVRLPKEILKQARLREGDELTVRVENGRIALEPTEPEITLEKLVAGITPRNRLRPGPSWSCRGPGSLPAAGSGPWGCRWSAARFRSRR